MADIERESGSLFSHDHDGPLCRMSDRQFVEDVCVAAGKDGYAQIVVDEVLKYLFRYSPRSAQMVAPERSELALCHCRLNDVLEYLVGMPSDPRAISPDRAYDETCFECALHINLESRDVIRYG